MIEFKDIKNDYKSYNFLINFYNQNKNKEYEKIDISFEGVKWVAANTCSIIGSIFQKLLDSYNMVSLYNINPKTRDILARNGFLAFMGAERKADIKGTTVRFLKLFPKDNRFFSNHIQLDLLNKEEIPSMSPQLKKKITEGIYEIFMNAAMHSDSEEGIFTCGQFYPTKNKIEFTITDLGVGIKHRVNSFLGQDLSAIDAIEWAMKERNTTKIMEPGGLGLAILKDFIRHNKGSIQIISNNGYWELKEDRVNKRHFDEIFPGTAVNICIKTDDTMHYRLTEEIYEDDIF